MFLLDTNVLSELRKARSGKMDRRVQHWTNEAAPASLYVSVVTMEELEIGAQRIARRDVIQGALLRTWLDEHVLPSFATRILDVDLEVARQSAALQVPDPRPIRDAYIAATALVHGLTVVTRNTRDFLACGARVLNPWEATT